MSNAAARGPRLRLLTASTALLTLGVAAVPGLAQVGHPPERSPFRDIPTRQAVTVGFGRFFGNRSEAGVGAQGGGTVSLRLQTRLGGPVDLLTTVSYITSKRTVIDPNRDVPERIRGDVDADLIAAELGLVLNLTGAKSWRRLAPYAGLAIGVIKPTDNTTDAGGYRAGTNFTLVPTAGARYIIGHSLALTFEVKDNTIRYEWPLAFFQPRSATGETLPYTPVLNPDRYDDRDVTHNLTLTAGLSYRFTF